jgi:AcrR family transcriptional regulator
MTQARGKNTREKLLNAAMDVFYTRGISGTTLQDIAEAAGVPLGNVYYHFKTKQDLIRAVIEARADELHQDFSVFEAKLEPKAALLTLITDSRKDKKNLTKYGCPYACLTADLREDSSDLVHEAGSLLEIWVEFATRQFNRLGKGKNSRALAESYVSGLQGGYLLARSAGSTATLERQLNRLEEWIQGL